MTMTSAERNRRYRSPEPGTALTDREVSILALAAEGRTNRAIARSIYISEDMAKNHMVRIRRKLGARDRAHAVSIAYQRGILRIPGCYCPRIGAAA